MGVATWILSRVLAAVGVVLGVSVLGVVLIGVLDGAAYGGRSVPVAVWDFLEGLVLRFDLGRSTDLRNQFRPVTDLLEEGFGPDLSLFGGALVIGLAAGLLGGAVCARRPGGAADRALSVVSLLAISAPVYWVGLVLILSLGRGVGTVAELELIGVRRYVPLLDDPGRWFGSLLVPWCVAAAPLAAVVLRLTRSAMRDAEQEDFVRTALGKGLRSWRVSGRHVLPAALPAPVSLAGAYAPLLVGNALLVEQVFNVPGAFRAFPRAVQEADYPVIQGLVLVGAVLVALANLAADLVLAGVDPRTRPWAAR